MNQINLNKILLSIIAALVLIILCVSAVTLCTKNAHPGIGLRHEDPTPRSVSSSKTAFDNIGQIRVFTKTDESDQKSVLVLIPWFEFEGSDQSFYEELDRKHMSLKALITNYFQRYTKAELLKMGEENIKSELKLQVNDNLVLGKVSAIYFNDYLFLD